MPPKLLIEISFNSINLKKGTIITVNDESREIKAENKRITIIPAYRWLLG